jgi:hypothetical protein
MYKLEFSEVDRLHEALKNYDGDAEKAINDVFHNEAGDLAQAEIKKLMPLSGKDWKGKAPAAKKSKSLRNIHSNLAETVTTAKKYQYLYFPNDGTNTRRHIGNQQFFERGGEMVQDEIIDRCISKLTNIL